MHLVVSLLLGLTIILSTPNLVSAQTDATTSGKMEGAATLGVARMVYSAESDLKDGHVVASSDHGAILSATPYDSQILGVVARDAAIIFNTTGSSSDSAVPVISSGEVYMLVSSQSGPIKKGDLLTSSTTPGVAVKATKSGYVLGTAKEDSSTTDPKEVDKIAVDLNLHYFNSKSPFPGSLSDILKIALIPTKEGPGPIFKYIVAAAVLVFSLVLGFLTFGRTAAKGVEALGRNPSAHKVIYVGIVFNISVVVVIVLSGLIIAFLILRL